MSWKMHSGRKSGTRMRLMSALSALLTLELISRCFRPDLVLRYEFDPDLGYQLRPNHWERFSDGESNLTYELTTNSFGFRGDEWVIPKPQGLRRVAVIGDSYIAAMAYPEERTVCRKLEDILNKNSEGSTSWQVMNFGIIGNNTPGELKLYTTKIRQFEPDVVLLCTCVGNDIIENTPETHNKPSSAVFCRINPQDELEFTSPERSNSRELRYKSRFYVWQRMQTQALINAVRESVLVDKVTNRKENQTLNHLAAVNRMTRQPLSSSISNSWEHFPKLLDAFAREVESDGARFVIVNLPVAWQVHRNLFELVRDSSEHPEQFDANDLENRFEKIADQLELTIVDLSQKFREESEGAPRPDYLFLKGYGHLTENGHQFLAEQLSELIHRYPLRSKPDRTNLARENVESFSR